jgi:hypothetical protein
MENSAGKNGKADAKKSEEGGGGLLYMQLRKLISIVVSILSLLLIFKTLDAQLFL